jgi:hypothetical protein
MMRQIMKCLVTAAVLSLLPSLSWAQQDLIASVKEGCEKELGSFCKEVTPGVCMQSVTNSRVGASTPYMMPRRNCSMPLRL